MKVDDDGNDDDDDGDNDSSWWWWWKLMMMNGDGDNDGLPNVCDDDCYLVMKVILVKEVMSCDVSPVAMFFV